MRKKIIYFLLIFILYLFIEEIFSQMYKYGPLLEDEVWSILDQPVFIKDNLIIPEDVVLVIKRGVTVYIDERKDRPIKIIVKGGLRIDGFKNKRVVFKPRTNNIPGPSWYGIIFDNPNDANTFILNADIEDAYYGIYVKNASFTIKNTVVKNCKIGMYIDSLSDMVVINSIFDHNDVAGIFVNSGDLMVASTIFYNNLNYGIYCSSKKLDPTVVYNNFWGNVNKNVWNCKDKFLGIPYRSVFDSITNDSIYFDREDNVIADPIFKNSSSEREKIKADLYRFQVDTNKINDKDFISMFIKKRKLRDPQRYKKGEYLLSPYSPCIDRGIPGENYLDEDSTRNDIGIYGGPFFPKF